MVIWNKPKHVKENFQKLVNLDHGKVGRIAVLLVVKVIAVVFVQFPI